MSQFPPKPPVDEEPLRYDDGGYPFPAPHLRDGVSPSPDVVLEPPGPDAPRFVTRDEANPKDLLGIRKVQLDLVPPAATIYLALAMQDGARKYGPFNWRSKKVKASIYHAAALRHLLAWFDGEELAADSGKPHLAHALACLGILVDATETGNLVDDRPIPGAASRLVARYEKKETP